MLTTKTEHTCPHCGAVHTAATSMGGENVPRPGCVSLCIDCIQWSIFTDDLSLRKPDVVEMAGIMDSKQCAIAADTMRRIKKQKGLK